MIKILSNETIQKIAAGEVIERPSSIVKELVENSVDANAKKITVEIKDGGIGYIKVSDNGNGIEKEDIDLAFKRHATSKLVNFNDLYNLNSLGFRGEALASIVAVSKVSITTRTINTNVGVKARFENSIKLDERPIGRNIGTSIEVKDLFYNVPVRKKFLKNIITEGNYISNLMYTLAIGNYKIGITYIKDEKVIFETKGNENLIDTIMDLFGNDLYNNLLRLEIEKNNIKIHGYVSNNVYYRANRSMEYLYINGRYVENKQIRDTIENAYYTIIPNGRFPAYQIFIDLNPNLLDVNIHPNKEKVNILILDSIIDTLKVEIKNIVSNSFLIPRISKSKEDLEDNNIKLFQNNDIKSLLSKFDVNSNSMNNINNFTGEYNKLENKNDSIKDNKGIYIEDDKNIVLKEDKTLLENNENTGINTELEEDNISIEEISFIDSKDSNYKYIGIIFNTYILYEDLVSKKIIFVDQHAAHERILYEKYLNDFSKEKIIIQELITPITMSVKEDEFNIYLKYKEILRHIGYDVEPFGNYTLALRTIPNILGIPKNGNFFLEILNNLVEFNEISDINSIVEMIISKSCKNAIKSGDSLAKLEADSLISKLMECEFPYTCPHGRPIMIEISEYELEKDFLRVK